MYVHDTRLQGQDADRNQRRPRYSRTVQEEYTQPDARLGDTRLRWGDGTQERVPIHLPRDPTREQFTHPRRPARTSSTPSKHTTAHDHTMADNQLKYDCLTPAEKELQDEWARKQIKGKGSACPYGKEYSRIQGGYLCSGRAHLVTDELLVEGRGGIWFARGAGKQRYPVETWVCGYWYHGPYYNFKPMKTRYESPCVVS